MSRRYGRKQRRAAQEMILDLACSNRMLQGRANDWMAERNKERTKAEFLLDRIRLWDSEIRSLLGPYTSFAINEPTFRVDRSDQIRQMPVMPPSPIGVLSIDSQIGMDSISYHLETMLGFMCGLDEDDLARLRRHLTVRVMVGSDPHGDAAYFAMSEHQWRHFKRGGPSDPGLERFIHRIAGDLVRLVLAPPPKKPSGDDLVPAMERDMRLRHLKDQGL